MRWCAVVRLSRVPTGSWQGNQWVPDPPGRARQVAGKVLANILGVLYLIGVVVFGLGFLGVILLALYLFGQGNR